MYMRKEGTKFLNYLFVFVLCHYFNSHNPSDDDLVGSFNSKVNENDCNKISVCKNQLRKGDGYTCPWPSNWLRTWHQDI